MTFSYSNNRKEKQPEMCVYMDAKWRLFRMFWGCSCSLNSCLNSNDSLTREPKRERFQRFTLVGWGDVHDSASLWVAQHVISLKMLARRYIIHERPSWVALQVSPLERGLRNCETILPAIPFHSTAIIMHKQMTRKIKHTKGADEVNLNLLSGDVLIRGVLTIHSSPLHNYHRCSLECG